jgi:hypothetical protein
MWAFLKLILWFQQKLQGFGTLPITRPAYAGSAQTGRFATSVMAAVSFAMPQH